MENVFNTLGGRKMTIALIGLVALVGLAYAKPEAITTEFVAALLGLVTAFNAANAFNTVKGPRNDSTPPSSPQLSPEVISGGNPVTALYQEFTTLQEETKVNAMNIQSQVDTTNSRIEALADIIQKSLLTQSPQSVKVMYNATTDERPVQNETKYTPSQADLNRQTIAQYFGNQQPNR